MTLKEKIEPFLLTEEAMCASAEDVAVNVIIETISWLMDNGHYDAAEHLHEELNERPNKDD